MTDRLHLPAQQKGIKIVFEAITDIEFSQSRCFRYAPCYLRFATSGTFEVARNDISAMLVSRMFDKMADLDYMMDEHLKKQIEPLFCDFIASGIRSEREGFSSTVKENLSLYLHGIPGIGKSTFVQTFSVALQAAIREQLDDEIQVNVVKIPLNAYANAWNLNQILQIQGISDWSVERLMEQSLTKGNLVLLHLEECPANPELQDSFFVCLNKMLDRKLWYRYPEYKANVLFVFTSNHDPSEDVRKFCRIYCTLKPPTDSMQRQWLQRKLKKSLSTKITQRFPMNKLDIDIEQAAFPKATSDVRPLNAFWISVGHALWRLLLKTSSDGKEISLKARRLDHVSLVVSCGVQEEMLLTTDGYFYFSPSTVSLKPNSSLDAKSQTILDMAVSGELTPAVIVLKDGPRAWQDSTSKDFSESLRQLLLPSTMFAETSIELLEADDESKVLGESGEIRGGLLKFIDDATNPNAAHKVKRTRQDLTQRNEKQVDVCLVHAKVNELGSVLLRELLEAGDKSRTHRLGVSKRGLVFVVSLVNGAMMTPQLESRAHQIISGLQ